MKIFPSISIDNNIYIDWITVPFGTVSYTANTPYAIMSEAVGSAWDSWSVVEIFSMVQQFNCGIYFDEEFIAANPDLKVTLELRIYPRGSAPVNGAVAASGIYTLTPPAPPVPSEPPVPSAPPAQWAPVTGDDSHVALWCVLFAACAAVAVLTRKKRYC